MSESENTKPAISKTAIWAAIDEYAETRSELFMNFPPLTHGADCARERHSVDVLLDEIFDAASRARDIGSTQPVAAQQHAQAAQGETEMLRDVLAIQEACGLHTDEYAPGSVIEYIKELEAEKNPPAKKPISKEWCERMAKAEIEADVNIEAGNAQAAQKYDFANLMMYPQEWDTAAYPTLESAMWEAISCAQIASAADHERDVERQVDAQAALSDDLVRMLASASGEVEGDEAEWSFTDTALIAFARNIAASQQPAAAPAAPFQRRVLPWMMTCFGAEISADKAERNHRFFEEATELVQALGMTSSEAHQLVDYTFGRDIGDPAQEVGGVMVTLAALCLAGGMDMHAAGETELARIWTKVDVIRAKQAAKPKHSPLPAAAPAIQIQEGAAPDETVSALMFMDELPAAQAGEKWIQQFSKDADKVLYTPDLESQAPRIKWCAYFDSYDRLVAAYLLTRDAKNWTQLSKVRGESFAPRVALAAPAPVQPAPVAGTDPEWPAGEQEAWKLGRAAGIEEAAKLVDKEADWTKTLGGRLRYECIAATIRALAAKPSEAV